MANRNKKNIWFYVTVITVFLLVLVTIPQNKKQWAPAFFRNTHIHFGLDLAGGTQLDFRISEQEIKEQILNIQNQIEEAKKQDASGETVASLEQQLRVVQEQETTMVEAIRTVLEKRINALGVSEAIITPSYVGNEKHLLVECPGVVSIQECIDIVGKTIKLEFKEEDTEPSQEYERQIRDKAATAFKRATESGDSLEVIGQDLGDNLAVAYMDNVQYFKDELPEGLANLWNKQPSDEIFMEEGVLSIPQINESEEQVTQDIPGLYLTQVIRERTQTGRTINEAATAFALLEKTESNAKYISHDIKSSADLPDAMKSAINTINTGELKLVSNIDETSSIVFLRFFQEGTDKMDASHILIAYKNATSASDNITISKKEALTLANDIRKKIENGENFEELAKQYSNGESAENGGNLGIFSRNEMTPEFSNVAFTLQSGEISDPVETAFGYHIIRANSSPVSNPATVAYEELILSGTNAVTQGNDIIQRLKSGLVQNQEEVVFLRNIFFSFLPTGWKDTTLDGKHFRTATVTLDPTTNIPVVQIVFDDEGAKIFQELTARNIEKQIAIFVGGELISAPTVQTEIIGGIAIITGMQNFEEAKELAQNLNTGAIPAPIYLAGQRTVEATLGSDALRTSMNAAIIGIIILMLYLVVNYRILGLVASLALSIYAFIFFALLKLPLFLFSDQYIVLTLAGMAGIILSIGMAVDANILIFERIKEELRKGKALPTAVDTGFKRAWPSIRDGNVSTFITCAILFVVGTSIIRGFAITLGLGVMLSMFSAIVITRWIIDKIIISRFASNEFLFIRKKKQLSE